MKLTLDKCFYIAYKDNLKNLQILQTVTGLFDTAKKHLTMSVLTGQIQELLTDSSFLRRTIPVTQNRFNKCVISLTPTVKGCRYLLVSSVFGLNMLREKTGIPFYNHEKNSFQFCILEKEFSYQVIYNARRTFFLFLWFPPSLTPCLITTSQ